LPKEYRTKDGNLIVIRRATATDFETYIRNFNEVAREEIYLGTERVSDDQKKRILDGMKNPKFLTIVAEYQEGKGGKKLVGNLTLSAQRNLKKMKHVRVLAMLIIDGYREKGVGSALMDYAISWAKKNKEIEKISLSVFSTNERAINLYKKFGFEVEGILRKQFILKGKYVDDIEMGLQLQNG
jgi:RimJ/RimL family protein N-acetyltransferase